MAVRSRCCASGRVCSSVPHYQSGRQRSCTLQCHYSSTQAPGSRSLLTGCGVVERPPSELVTDWETDLPWAQNSGVSLSLGGSQDSALQSHLLFLQLLYLSNVVAEEEQHCRGREELSSHKCGLQEEIKNTKHGGIQWGTFKSKSSKSSAIAQQQ